MAKQSDSLSFSMVNPQAAGIDIGSRINWTCIGPKSDDIRSFGVFTEDHHEMARWLQSHQIKTIAMESTGFYWKSLFLILQSYGFEVVLVNAAQTKNVKGKKTDIKDCQWIWQLHSVGLLCASFQPDEFTEELRTINRHRKSLIEGASRYVAKMQKALTLMNLQLPLVLSDITGKSGRAIIEAILAGQRDGDQLAKLADPRVKADKATIAKALTGYWHEQHLFTLEQCWQMYKFYQKQISQCDTRIEALLQTKAEQTGQNELVYTPPQKKKYKRKNDPDFEVAQYAYQFSDGIDLMAIDGVGRTTILTLMTEVGLDLDQKFPSAKHFTSWLGLCPNKKVSGGRVLSSKTRRNKHHLALAFRQAANSVGNQKDTALSGFFRRIAFRKGRKAAITATARKIAVITYQMITKQQAYLPQDLEQYQQKLRNKKIKDIQRTMKKLQIEASEIAQLA